LEESCSLTATKTMRIELLKATVEIPSGVTVSVNNGTFVVKGPKGEVTRRLYHDRVKYAIEGSEVVLTSPNATKREKTVIYTMAAHIRNLIKGVQEGFSYKLKICSGHFPMTVAVKGDTLEVKNFIGEAVPRRLKLDPNCKVVIEGVIITVEGIDVEAAGQQASSIERLCRRVGFDRRVFQDGIYITHKGEEQL
jgi:large subunit ribosomal protein L6